MAASSRLMGLEPRQAAERAPCGARCHLCHRQPSGSAGRDNSSSPGAVDDDQNDTTDLNNYEESASQSLTAASTAVSVR